MSNQQSGNDPNGPSSPPVPFDQMTPEQQTAYSMAYYAAYYPEYYAQLQNYYASASAASASYTTAVPKPSNPDFIPSPAIMPALGSRLAGDKAIRQMSHFFDYESYNDSVNRELREGKRGPIKFTKKEIKVLRQRRQDKKKKRMLAWLHQD